MVVVAALMGLIWQFDAAERFGELSKVLKVDRLKELSDGTSLLSGVLLGIAGLVALVVLMRILSIGWAILQFFGFHLERRGDDLRVEQGLLTRVSKTIPRHRIQVLSTRDGPLHRWLGLTSIRVETAGGSNEEHGPSGGRSLWLAPLIREERVAGLLREVLPEVPFDAPDWQPICQRAWLRIFRAPLFVLLPISIVGWFGIGAWVLLPVSLLGILAYLNARLHVRHAAYALLPGAIAYRRGWWARRTNIVRFEKIQSVERAESPFDRRHGMASVHVDTAGGGAPGGHSIDASYLEAAVATALHAKLGDAAARTAFRW
jgi:putative membrane protein